MNKKLFSTTSLKLIAVISMFIDHLAAVFYPELLTNKSLYLLMRIIGRIAFPLFAFVLVEGFSHTRNRKRYIQRMFIFALLTEPIFDLAFTGQLVSWQQQNVMFTFTIGLFVLNLFERYKLRNEAASFFVLILGIIVADLLRVDYRGFGIVMIMMMYFLRNNRSLVLLSIVILNLLITGFQFKTLETSLQAFGGLSILFIHFYNEKRGAPLKYFFYLFYPVHLLLLYVVYIHLI